MQIKVASKSMIPLHFACRMTKSQQRSPPTMLMTRIQWLQPWLLWRYQSHGTIHFYYYCELQWTQLEIINFSLLFSIVYGPDGLHLKWLCIHFQATNFCSNDCIIFTHPNVSIKSSQNVIKGSMHHYPDQFTDTDDGMRVNGWYYKDFSQMCSLKSIKCQSLYRSQDIVKFSSG